jgi:hypothetical protein
LLGLLASLTFCVYASVETNWIDDHALFVDPAQCSIISSSVTVPIHTISENHERFAALDFSDRVQGPFDRIIKLGSFAGTS